MGRIGDSGQQRVYVVMLDAPNNEAVARITGSYASSYQLSGQAFLVRTKDLAETVAITAGIKGDDRVVSGVVFKLNTIYAGYTSRTLWDWLSEAE